MNSTSQVENHLHSEESRWFAVSTKYKREKVVYKELSKKGIKTYLPLQKILRQYGRKKKWVELPLFGSYIFVKITKKEYVPVLATEGVIQFIRFSQNLISIPEFEISTIQKILDSNILIEVAKYSFQEEDEVEIISGPLLGMKGKLLDVQGKNKVLIELTHLGYTLKLEIPPSFLRRLEAKEILV